MRWTPGGRSKNLEDLRGQTGGGGGRMMLGGRGMGLGGAVIALILALAIQQYWYYSIVDFAWDRLKGYTLP